MKGLFTILGSVILLTSNIVQADVVFQDSFNSATAFSSKWQVSKTGNGGTAKVQNGKLVIETVGGSDGYMGKADGVSLSPKLSSFNLTNKTIEFNLHELIRKQNSGYKGNVGFSFELVSGDKRFAVYLAGNYSGYSPDQPGCGWACYDTYNGHSLWIREYIPPSDETYFVKTDLNKSSYYNYFFRVTLSADKVVIGYRTEEQADFTYKTANISGYNMPTSINLATWSGDGGYTRKNAAGKFEVDSFVIYDNVAACN